MSGNNETNALSNSFLMGVCDYRANYLGCDLQLVQYFAAADLVIIVLTVISIVAFSGKIIQNVLSKVIRDGDGKKKWNAIDTTCALCCLSNVFRIVQIVNVRSLAFRDKYSMDDAEVVKYVQINILMDIIYYGTGVLSATTFVSSVVGAAAGVNLYSDIQIGNTVISPSKFFRIFRIVVLVLALGFNISWATVGTSTNLFNYTRYRRAGYVVAMLSIALVTIPMMVYFSYKVVGILLNGLQGGDLAAAEQTHDGNRESMQGTKITSEVNSSKINTNPDHQSTSPEKKFGIPVSKSNPSLNQRKTVIEDKKRKVMLRKIEGFRFAVNTTLWCLYVTTFFNLMILIIGFEVDFFQENDSALLVLKILSDLSVWVSCGFMTFYLYLYC
ncbi:hypothetical protein HDV06_005358 [Boothiomyces sp. JEL0866]|nr:hypothetical protein HDV06_005358 [Boothiomyces sp. JEL0866]